jgi:adenylate cyclase
MKCSKCKFDNPEGAKFCIECGQHFGEKVARRAELAIEGERKQVTVLFSDLTGYTAMSEKLDPEEVKEITSRIFGEISKIVAKYDGFIEKYAGDAVMALFGVSVVYPIILIHRSHSTYQPEHQFISFRMGFTK